MPLFISACAANKPVVLIIGDSISLGYTPYVQQNLANKYEVHHIQNFETDNNARNTWYTLQKVDGWLKQYPKPAIIIWNNGIWNTFTDRTALDKGTTTAQFQSDIQAIAPKLTATGARVIYLTTTDEPAGASNFFNVGQEVTQNSIAESVLPALGVELHDLYGVASDYHISSSDVHFTTTGYQVLAASITNYIQGL